MEHVQSYYSWQRFNSEYGTQMLLCELQIYTHDSIVILVLDFTNLIKIIQN